MKKPKKKIIRSDKDICLASPDEDYDIGYNQACEDWEAFLPSETEIADAIPLNWRKLELKAIAKAIYKRMR
ncbi:unnamed protein product, partial [marine sediment metagenome]